MKYNVVFRFITGGILFLMFVSQLFSQTTEIQTPYAEASTGNFEVVVAYNNIEPNKDSKLIFYISDYKTNVPIDNAKIGLDIAGIDNSKITIQPSLEPGIYEALVEFPEIKKYNFLLSIEKDGVNDLIAFNDVDLGKKENITIQDNETKSIITIVHENLLLIILTAIIFILIAFVFYKIGKNKSSTLNSNSSENTLK